MEGVPAAGAAEVYGMGMERRAKPSAKLLRVASWCDLTSAIEITRSQNDATPMSPTSSFSAAEYVYVPILTVAVRLAAVYGVDDETFNWPSKYIA